MKNVELNQECHAIRTTSGFFYQGKKNRGILIPSDGELVPQFSEKVLNEGATNLQKEYPDIVAELNHVVQQVSRNLNIWPSMLGLKSQKKWVRN